MGLYLLRSPGYTAEQLTETEHDAALHGPGGADDLSATFGALASLNTWALKQLFSGEIEIDGALNHDGATVGFYGVAPAARPAAYTQTYATPTKTHAAPTATDTLTTGATAVTPFGYTTASQANDIPVKINALIADLANLKQVVNAMIDDLQSLGLLQ